MDEPVVTLVSTSDTLAEVQQALGVTPEEAVPATAETPADDVTTDAATARAATDEAAPADDATETDDATEAIDETAPAVTDASKPAKKPSRRLQARIDEIVRERDTARGRAAAIEAENRALHERIAAIAGGKPADKGADASADDAQTPAKVDAATEKPKLEDFPDYDEFVVAISQWAATDALAKKAAADAQAAKQAAYEQSQRAADDVAAKAVVAAKQKYADYDEVTSREDLQVPNLVFRSMRQSPLGAEVAYYLGSHPDECAALNALGNTVEASIEYGRILARVEAAAAVPAATSTEAPAKKDVKKVVTKAPDPLTPVTGETKTAVLDPDKMSHAQFKAWRESNIKAAGGRR